jgi:hypothetical protein|tara:strand:+ start:154 stop:903 length:750 start_codon:yes stop_codon:yes gene_type:complete
MSIQKVNISDSSMISIIKTHIKERRGLSLTRFGDGEIHILNKRLTPSLTELFTTKFKYENPNQCLDDCRVNLISALKNTDYIGIMGSNSISNALGNTWPWGFDSKFLQEAGRLKDLNIFDCMLVRGNNIGSPNGFKKLIGSNPICIVTPITNELKKNNLEKHLGVKISYVKVPFGGNLKNRDGHFKELDKIKENIVIISNSLYGKDFPQYLSKKGKVCIDMGATMDAWAGKITRPWFNDGNLQSHCLIK